LPATSLQSHGHGHGHKKGSLDSVTDDSSTTTPGQIPVGSTQNLFGSLLSSLEQIIGGQTTQPSQSAAQTGSTQAATTAQTATAPLTTIGSRISLLA
jgi:hypothetical protein